MPERRVPHLFIPGPAGATPEVLESLGQPATPHYGPAFVDVYNRCRRGFQEIFRTSNDLYLIAGPGTSAIDAAMMSALRPGSRVLALANGWFGARTAEMSRYHGADVEVMEFELGTPVDADRVIERLRSGPRFDMITWIHHETTTGVLNPVEPISRAARELGTLSLVDAVSSLGGTDVRVDDWCLDFCISVPNKCLGAPAGLSPITVSPQAWEAIDSHGDSRGWYLDLKVWRRYDEDWAAWHPYPTTVPTGVAYAVETCLEQVFEEGLEARFARTRAAASAVRSALGTMGFDMFVPEESASPTTTAVRAHPEIPTEHLLTELAEKHDVFVSAGIGDLHGKIFRVGHMGTAIDEPEVRLLIDAIGDVLAGAGLEVPVAAGTTSG